ncbi:hypothetical protein [Rhodoblastus sp.]|uniref:hypothetical protein n=1 Tax=Rhodoblastus sp. TaxID=1962975 RepID=UPI003F962E0C
MPRPAKRAERYAHPYNAAITMYRGRRADSPYWEAQFKMPDGKLLYRATGVSDKSQAEKIAYDRYQETMKAVSEGRGVGLRKFRTAAELTIKALDAELEASGLVGTEAHKITKHITTIRNHLLPKFGELPLAGITERDVDAYAASLKGRNGQKAAKSTISNHNHSLQLVFRTALKEGWVSKADVAIPAYV